jgi:hypothetical protein
MAEDARQLLLKAAEHVAPVVPSGLLDDLGAVPDVNPPRSAGRPEIVQADARIDSLDQLLSAITAARRA